MSLRCVKWQRLIFSFLLTIALQHWRLRSSLISQTCRDFRLVISDQTEDFDAGLIAEVQSVLRVLRSRGHPIEIHKRLPRQGMAEHRQFLLDQVTAPYALFLDDDLILESHVVQQTLTAIQEESCGLIPSGVYHQELETTIHDRTINAPVVLSLLPS